MTNQKWTYVASGHYSSPADKGDGTIHVLEDGAVYITSPSKATEDVTGSKADRYIASAQKKFRVRGKMLAEPAREPEVRRAATTKPSTKPKTKKKMKKLGAAAKKAAKGMGVVIGTTRAFVSMVGEAEEAAQKKRYAPQPKAKKVQPKKKKVKPPKKTPRPTGRPTIVRKKKVKPPKTRTQPEMEHPLEYLMSGGRALPPAKRKSQKKQRDQTYGGWMGL